jgi:hypothetical protein
MSKNEEYREALFKMLDSGEVVLLHVYIEKMSTGNIATEELPVFPVGDNLYRLAVSPGVTATMAKGDVIKFLSSELPAEVIERGGNVCVQVIADYISYDEALEAEREIEDILHGSWDGWTERNIVFSVPVSVGFENIQRLFDHYSGTKSWVWCYGNVYEEDNVTPLNWWSNFRFTNN